MIIYFAAVATYNLVRIEFRATRKFCVGAYISACAKQVALTSLRCIIVYDILLHS